MRIPNRLRARSPWLWASLVLATAALVLQFLPLTRELHYELAAVVALATSVAAGLAALVTFWRAGADPSPVPSTLRALGGAALSTVAPLAIAVGHGLLAGSCGMLDGLLWYLVLVPPAALIAVVVARLAAAVVSRRWLHVVIVLGLWSASMIRGAYEALTGPHIFLYTWQVGYFPGGSWDPELTISPLLLLYRIGHLLVATLLLLVVIEIDIVRRGGRRGGRRRIGMVVVPAALVAAIVVALLPLRSEIGLTRSDAWLRATLGDSLRTRFTTIYYHAASTDSLDLWRAANYADFYVRRHAGALGLDSGAIAPITFYAYASAGEQKRLVGTSSASFTKPWRRTLNIAFDRVESTLEHELAHIVLEPFGNVLGVSWSNGLLEGSAVALEHADDPATLHSLARAAYDADLAPAVSDIMSPGGFASKRASLSYMLAGSFCRWLIDTYGAGPFVDAYASGDLDGSYGVGEARLVALHREFLGGLPATGASAMPTVAYLYGGGSFFLQRCLRRQATLSGEGYRALAEERYDEALELFGVAITEGITSSARAGVIRALHGAGRYAELVDSIASYRADSAGHWLLPYGIELGDALGSLALAGAPSPLDDPNGNRSTPTDGMPAAPMKHAGVAELTARRAAELTRVLERGGEEWTRVRAAMRLAFSPLRVEGVAGYDELERHMLGYVSLPMTPLARLASLDEAIGILDRMPSRDHFASTRELLSLMRAHLLVRSTPATAIAAVAARPRVAGAGHECAPTPAGAVTAPIDTTMPPGAAAHAVDAGGGGSVANAYRSALEERCRAIEFARGAFLRTLLDARICVLASDGRLDESDRSLIGDAVRDAYDVTTPTARADALVVPEKPYAEVVEFVRYLARYGPILRGRSRR